MADRLLDALDAIYKQYKKKVSCTYSRLYQHTVLIDMFVQADDEFENPYLAGFEWDKEEHYSKFKVHQKATGDAPMGKKKKGKAADEE